MKVCIVHTSRERPQIAKATAEAWLAGAPPSAVHYIMGVEDTEAGAYLEAVLGTLNLELATIPTAGWLRLKLEDICAPGFQWPAESEIPKYLTANTKTRLLIQHALTRYELDWIIGVADNLMPPADWYNRLLPELIHYRGAAKVLAYACQVRRRLISHAIVSRPFAERCDGAVQYEGYYHSHGDAELFLRAYFAGELRVLPEDLNPTHNHHYHTGIEADALCLLDNSQLVHEQAEPIFQRRRLEIFKEFGVEE